MASSIARQVNKNVSVPDNAKSQIAFVKTDSRVGGEYDIYLMRPGRASSVRTVFSGRKR